MTIVDTTAGDASAKTLWTRLPLIARAVIAGLLVCLPAANVIVILAAAGMRFSSPLRLEMIAGAEVGFLFLFLWWARGGGWPISTKSARRAAGRAGRLSASQWQWSIFGALAFAVTIHALMVIVFRIVPFPVELFRKGYDFSQLPSTSTKWAAILLAAASAGITEETGFRGYMQQPIEQRHGAVVAIAISTLLFLVAHLNQSWAVPVMWIVGGAAAVLLGLFAWSSQSLIPGMVAHTIMDVGFFSYWWTGTLGTLSARTISKTGFDLPFVIACSIFACALLLTLVTIGRLRALRAP